MKSELKKKINQKHTGTRYKPQNITENHKLKFVNI